MEPRPEYQHLKQQQRVFVISDLHLGGRKEAGRFDTRMCGHDGASDLAAFLIWVRGQHTRDWPSHLILNGDIVDFLAERREGGGYDAFTASEPEAHRKLCRILSDPSYAPILHQMRLLVGETGGRLTLLMGNHDVELCLPSVRRELAERLGPGRVEFITDNEGLALGDVLIEHGNRYDGWNYLKHNLLRACRSLSTRRDPNARFAPPPGSQLVVDVINELKPLFPFIDLLKPEDEATLRVLRALAPPSRRKLFAILRGAKGYIAQLMGKLGMRPVRGAGENASSGSRADSAVAESERREEDDGDTATGRALALSLGRIDEVERELRQLGDSDLSGGEASGTQLLSEVKAYLARRFSDADRRNLHAALRSHFDRIQLQLDVTMEKKEYRSAAQEAADRGFRVVVYGHTHLPKRVVMKSDAAGRPTALYLNTGTWADLMFVEPGWLASGTTGDEPGFVEFIADLRSGDAERVYRHRHRCPCYAQIELGVGGACDPATSVGLYRFDKNRPDGRQIIGGALPELTYTEG